jgi:NADPH-dependent 2,4-dienoyl-CoA reductase/sulfur reductase-like enzyme
MIDSRRAAIHGSGRLSGGQILVIGAGPAGIAAAITAAKSHADVTLLDDNPSIGGQIWRNADSSNPWLKRLWETNVRILNSTRVVSGDPSRRTLLIEKDGQSQRLTYSKLILATGARELFLPFPGWTLPNVMGVGGLQALVKSGLPVSGKRIIVAGSGPLLLAVASYLQTKGATVPLIAEQTNLPSLIHFTAGLIAHPAKLVQAINLRPRRYLTNCWIEAALGTDRVQSVRLRQGSNVWEEPCDYVANAHGFVPNTELAVLLGCALEDRVVKVDAMQQTSVPDIYCAGEPCGIGGVDTALIQGQIAGYAASGQTIALGSQLRRARSFARALNQTFHPRPELRSLAQPDTIICRCEDVPLTRLRTCDSWRSAKLHERCGMGPCQGRICGPAVQFILGWEPSSVRPPIFPTRLDTLIEENSVK